VRGLEERRVDLDGGRVNACVAGDGPPVLLLHGLAGSWRYWYRTVEALSDRHTVIAPDLPGFGHSSPLAGAYTADRLAALLHDACVALGAGQATVVGHSFGGSVALALATRRPQTVGALLLAAPTGIVPAYMERLAFLLPAVHAPLRWLPRWERQAATRRQARRALFSTIVPDGATITPYDALLLLRGASRATQLRPGIAAAVRAEGRADAARLRIPVQVIWGDRDRCVPLRGAGELARLVPHADVRIWHGVGHMPMLERPAEFADAVSHLSAQVQPQERDLHPV
jgi:pimeloyl-ACP methyl ester carboxylesterase